jgi:osmotically-inducible protein OsmY
MRIQTRSRRSASLALALIIPLFTASFAAKCGGSNNNNKADNVNGPPQGVGKKVDDQLGREIRRLISKNERNVPGLSGLELHVFCVNRKVSITGTVGTDAARDEAIRIARETEVEVEGQKYKAADVDVSQFTVKPAASTSPSPSASPSP